MAYEITCNPEIQQKLYEEVSEIENMLKGEKLTYEKIQGMKYMDQVVCETLRHWPIGPVSCVKLFLPLKFHFLDLNIPLFNFFILFFVYLLNLRLPNGFVLRIMIWSWMMGLNSILIKE
jgi:hypothetical protein